MTTRMKKRYTLRVPDIMTAKWNSRKTEIPALRGYIYTSGPRDFRASVYSRRFYTDNRCFVFVLFRYGQSDRVFKPRSLRKSVALLISSYIVYDSIDFRTFVTNARVDVSVTNGFFRVQKKKKLLLSGLPLSPPPPAAGFSFHCFFFLTKRIVKRIVHNVES